MFRYENVLMRTSGAPVSNETLYRLELVSEVLEVLLHTLELVRHVVKVSL